MEDNRLKDNTLIKEFNKKYNTEINADKSEIEVFSRQIGNDDFKLLCSISFNKNIEKLVLEENYISNIKPIEGSHFGNKMLLLDLSSNGISDISPLEKVDLHNLKSLFLNNNKIMSIDIIHQISFPNLTELNLSSNHINSIDIFIKSNLPSLKELYLSKNKINSIESLSNANFPKLRVLTLDENNINSIDVLVKVNLPEIKELRLEKNKIQSIKLINKALLPKLSFLSIGDEVLEDNIDNLINISLPLKSLYLYFGDKININSEKIRNIKKHFEKTGVYFHIAKITDINNSLLDHNDDYLDDEENENDEDDKNFDNFCAKMMNDEKDDMNNINQ